MTHKALIRQLQISCLGLDPIDPLRLLVDDVIAALAKQEQEPVAYWKEHAQGLQRDYDSLLADFQAQRTWVGLTDEEIAQGCKESWVTEQAWQSAVWWAEAKLKELNT
jgi:hypothetical protein